jgi:uncharacterized protein YjbI with pentapeptide repeats
VARDERGVSEPSVDVARGPSAGVLIPDPRHKCVGSVSALSSLAMTMGMHDALTFEPILTSREKRDLHHEVFRDRMLVGLDLSGADLRGTRLERTVLATCNLAGANLRGAQFILCDLRSVDLTNAGLGDNDFRGSMLTDIMGLSDGDRALIQESGGSFQHAAASLR